MKPVESFIGAEGREVKVGDKVAYNLSGTLAIGRVTMINTTPANSD
jgi:hypothetical protein